MSKINRTNINIGKDYWIVWVEPDMENKINVDELLEPTWSFWQKLETECVAMCCGIYAFSFWPEDIKMVVKDLDEKQFLFGIEKLKNEIEQSDFHSVTSELLNDTLEKSVFVRLITHIEHSLKGWVE